MVEVDLKVLTEQWLAIQDRNERNSFYDEAVFPAIKQVVVAREQAELPVPYTHLILPVGLSPEPLILSILILRPEKVYLLYTRASERYLDRIFQETGLRLSQVDKDEVDETNVPDIYQKVKAIYTHWGRPDRIAVDVSGGKKSMVGGCALAGALIGARLFYMDSDFLQEFRKPSPGSERLAILSNPYDVFGDLELERAKALFHELDFAGAKRLLGELAARSSTPEQYTARAMLCEAYAAWDDWDITSAHERLSQVIGAVEKFARRDTDTPLAFAISSLRQQLDVLERLKQAQALLAKSESELDALRTPKFFQPMLGSLRATALRQEQRGKRDVAALLWYRTIEFLSQQRLSSYNLRSGQIDYTQVAGGASAELLERYQKAFKTDDKKGKTKLPEVLPDEVDLTKGYAFLQALGDEFAQKVHFGKIRSKVNARNKGVFAHGFVPLSQTDYEDFKSLALDLLGEFRALAHDYADDWNNCEFIEAL
ncbi:MAG: TIGR02710 family CRISPR-associated protein [Chloroflexi bacterium]|nr:TIGR02710 family CRISPR-associated protein [Chloroflexota bacterium]